MKTQIRMINACALLHNHCKREMPNDQPEEYIEPSIGQDEEEEDRIMYVESSEAWNQWRNNLAAQMWNEHRQTRRNRN